MSDNVTAYAIERVLNNNVLILQAKNGDEQIVIGRGIGFGARRGSVFGLGDPRIEKRFSLVHAENQQHFEQLFSVVPNEVVGIAEEIIALATRELGVELHEHIHVALADHIGFALTRLQGGINIENPFLEEIKMLYPQAWSVAKTGAAWIEDRFHIAIPEEEVGFLTLHLHSASHAHGIGETVRVTDAVTLAVHELERILGKPLPRTQLNYARMVIHLRFAIQRVLRDEPIQNPLADVIMDRLPESFEVAKRVAQVIESRLKIAFPTDEIAYLTLHVERLSD
ncbi:transcription antiterminator [Alicyclobacillus fastidiosus]|uniref:Transcription antiterminator n=1 Tax=Alicyclobacillus fastidiosus TaxID=392011 RepID=A0ABY6ZE27_9BACL|nr:transcription antiterminator [Alicyclobacillus fastidiosus]WAH41149.1 transcription antiterminator [Alicyclobacillus fastidiosus]GMA62712.1 transcription antiterminator BglG [Alicyclobacillus fastidiosus]